MLFVYLHSCLVTSSSILGAVVRNVRHTHAADPDGSEGVLCARVQAGLPHIARGSLHPQTESWVVSAGLHNLQCFKLQNLASVITEVGMKVEYSTCFIRFTIENGINNIPIKPHKNEY